MIVFFIKTIDYFIFLLYNEYVIIYFERMDIDMDANQNYQNDAYQKNNDYQQNNNGGYYQQNDNGGYYQQNDNGGYYQQSTRETKFCSNCGQTIDKNAVICPKCGCQVSQMANQNPMPQQIIINNSNNNVANAVATGGVGANPKNKWVAFLLCFFLGFLGAHKFYEGKAIMGVLYLFTGGLFLIGVIVDLIIILCRPNPYYI